MNFWIVKIYFISTFLVLVGIFLFIFGECKLSFYIWTALWLKKYDVFYFSPDNTIELSRDILGWAPSSWVSTLPSFGGHGPCECADKTFLICHMTTWMICHVTLLVGFPYRNLPLAKFGIGLLKVEILSFWFVTWPQYRNVTLPYGWGPLVLSHHPVKFEVHRPCERGDITFLICHVTTISTCHVTLWVKSPHSQSPPCKVWGPWA